MQRVHEIGPGPETLYALSEHFRRLVSDNYQRELRAKINWVALNHACRAPGNVKAGHGPDCTIEYTSFVGFLAEIPVLSAHEAM